MPWVFLDKCYQEIFLFSIGIFIKLFIIHYFMGLGHNLLSITLANFFVVIGLFCLVSLVNEYKRIKIYFISNIALSLIFFIDAMYYSHFFTLIPVHSIYQLGQVGSVSGSIMALIKPWYFLLFIDSFYLWHYYKGRH